jgi:hypothetical protein
MITVTEMPKESGKYATKRKPVRAIQFHTAFVFENENEKMQGMSGDYLVEVTPRNIVIVPLSKFNELYEPWQS